jgi:uncharacterized membrane protein
MFRIVAPLHPIFVHFSIALSTTSFAFDLAAALLGRVDVAVAGWWTLAATVVMTLGTIVTGIVSRLRVPLEEGEARAFLRAHMALGPIFFGLLLMLATWRAATWDRGVVTSWTYLAAMGGVLLLMAVQGYVGGELVYRYGVEVQGHFRPLASERVRDASLVSSEAEARHRTPAARVG